MLYTTLLIAHIPTNIPEQISAFKLGGTVLKEFDDFHILGLGSGIWLLDDINFVEHLRSVFFSKNWQLEEVLASIP